MEDKLKKIIDMVKMVKPQLETVDETTVLNNGTLDSLDVMLLVSFMEKEFNVKIAGICLKQQNFETPATLLSMIESISK